MNYEKLEKLFAVRADAKADLEKAEAAIELLLGTKKTKSVHKVKSAKSIAKAATKIGVNDIRHAAAQFPKFCAADIAEATGGDKALCGSYISQLVKRGEFTKLERGIYAVTQLSTSDPEAPAFS